MIRVVTSSIGTVLEQIILTQTGLSLSCPECKDDVATLNAMCPCEVLSKIGKHAGRIVNRAMSRKQPWYLRLVATHVPKLAISVVSEWITRACLAHINGEYPVTTIWQVDDAELRAADKKRYQVAGPMPVMIPTPGRYAGKMSAVTSLSPNPARIARQLLCLESLWNIGIQVIAVNTSEEFSAMSADVKALVIPHVSQDVTTDYDRPTQKVYTLIQAGRATGLPFMVINSDIEVYGDHSLIDAALDDPDKLTIGVRYNHTADQDREQATFEPYGLDAFLMTTQMADTVPHLPFGVGKPMWDYWIPEHFRSRGYGFRWIREPLFFHERHPIAWSKSEWDIGAEILEREYGVKMRYSAATYRDELDESTVIVSSPQ
jgi:hypothetical protein